MEKRKEDYVAKNKASSPRLDFPLCLKTVVKQGDFQKSRTALLGTMIKIRLVKYVSRMIPKHSMTQFSKYLLLGTCGSQLA